MQIVLINEVLIFFRKIDGNPPNLLTLGKANRQQFIRIRTIAHSYLLEAVQTVLSKRGAGY